MESLDGFGYEGFVVDLALAISKIVGFNFTIVPTDGYGSVGKDGRWNGMIRELLEEVKTNIPNDTHIIETVQYPTTFSSMVVLRMHGHIDMSLQMQMVEHICCQITLA